MGVVFRPETRKYLLVRPYLARISVNTQYYASAETMMNWLGVFPYLLHPRDIADWRMRTRSTTETNRTPPRLVRDMSPTVDELRNEIRVAVGRFEREISTAFTKEDLLTICEALGYESEGHGRPPTAEMRAGILWKAGVLDEPDPDAVDGNFRKADLEAIAAALEDK